MPPWRPCAMGEQMLKFIGELILGLFPRDDDDMKKLYEWRWKSVFITFVSMVIGAYAASLLPFVKPPYAMANIVEQDKASFQTQLDTTNRKLDITAGQLNMVMQELKQGQIRSLNTDLIDARRYQCRAINSNDTVTLPFWTGRIETLKQSYHDLTGNPWPNLDCKSF